MGQATTHHRPHFGARGLAPQSRCARAVGHRLAPGRKHMKARLIVACVCVVLVSAGGSWAGDVSEASGGACTGRGRGGRSCRSRVECEDPIKPWIHPAMPESVSARLEAGFELAVERVREVESCGDLFAELGADAARDAHDRSLPPSRHTTNARSRSAGGTPPPARRELKTSPTRRVGGAPTWICRHFARVSTETAAIAVIHEALHHAGLTETAPRPDGDVVGRNHPNGQKSM